MEGTPRHTVIVSHGSALRAVRVARRRYARLPWRPLGLIEQRRVLAACAPNRGDIDMGLLYREGLWDSEHPETPIEVLVTHRNQTRHRPGLRCHVCSSALPAGSILEIAPGIYSVSPALTLAQYARSHDFPEVVALAFELCGTFSLKESHVPGEICFNPSDHERESGYFESDPAIHAKELGRQLEGLAGIGNAKLALRAARHTLDGARSPGEAIMASLFHLPFAAGGFAIRAMRLNHKVPFSREARAISGMPYAVCDAYVPESHTTLEYNGAYHDLSSSRIHDERRAAGLKAMGITTDALNRIQLADIDALEAEAIQLYRRAGARYQNRARAHRVKQVELLNGLRRAFGWPEC